MPVLSETLTVDDAELVDRQRQWWEFQGRRLFSDTRADGRKEAALDRHMILRGDFDPLVVRKLDSTHYDFDVRKKIRKHINVSINIGADITGAVACVYKVPATRRLANASDDEVAALRELNTYRRIDTLAQQINRMAFLVGPVLEVPLATSGGVRTALFSPESYDVSLDPDDPFGCPLKVCFSWWGPGGQREIWLVDQERVRMFDTGGNPIPGRSYEHGVTSTDGEPMLPATVWRMDAPVDPMDWWGKARHRRLVDSTVECAVVHTTMSWVRKAQNRKLPTFFGNLDKVPKAQVIDNERGFASNVSGEDVIPQFSIHDFITPVDAFINHMMFEYRTQIEAFGIPQSALTFDFGVDGSSAAASLSIQHERLSQLRNEQIPWMRESESRSQYVAASVASGAGVSTVDPQRVADDFVIEFPELNRIDDPQRLQEHWDWRIKRGLATEVDVWLAEHPTRTRQDGINEIMTRLDEQADLNDIRTTRNLALNGEVPATAAEAYGAVGPVVRDNGRTEPDPSE